MYRVLFLPFFYLNDKISLTILTSRDLLLYQEKTDQFFHDGKMSRFLSYFGHVSVKINLKTVVYYYRKTLN